MDPEILGGAIVRVGERIHDGSVRRRMTKLRRILLSRDRSTSSRYGSAATSGSTHPARAAGDMSRSFV